MRYFLFLFALLAAGCTLQPTQQPTQTRPTQVSARQPAQLTARQQREAQLNFVIVVKRMEPVIEAACRSRTPDQNCDFEIVVDDRPGNPPNAFQTVSRSGQPILGFTLALIYDVRNRDELAFVVGHESAHHILRHLGRQRQNATAGAIVFGTLASAAGASPQAVNEATRLGAAVGARTYSKDFELEADALGARLTQRAGFDAIRGAAYFTRIPDPGNELLGTHPPNAQRVAAVRRALGR